LLRVSNVEFTYTPGKPVLSGLDFNLAPGERLGIVGANGSGKTTLARLCCGLLTPSRGTIAVDGIDTRDAERICEVRQTVGLVFQDPDDQLVETSIEREVAFGLRNIGLSHEELSRRLEEALSVFELERLRDRPCSLLSAGEKQLVNLASIFALRPNYIILDESTAFLDSPSRKRLLVALERLLHVTGAGLIFISNRLEDIWFCDRVGMLDDGRFSFLGGKVDFLRYLLESRMPLCGLWFLLRNLKSELPEVVDAILRCKRLNPGEMAGAIVDFKHRSSHGNST